MEKITVFLSDWQVLFREGIHFTLSGEDDLIVTGESKDNKDALDFISGNPPDIAIVNINHSDFTGVHLSERVRRDYPGVSVVLVMDTDNEDQLYAALKGGAAACVSKDIDPDELVGVIRRVAKGNLPISMSILRPGVAAKILEDFASFDLLNKEVDGLLSSLTTREVTMLQRIGEGDTIDDILPLVGITADDFSAGLGIIRRKLEENEHCRQVVEASQKGLSTVIKRASRTRKTDEFISRDEFESFRESLRQHFKLFTEE